MPIEWYEHTKDERTLHHVYYRMPGENYYGFSPPKEPPGECAVCGCEIYDPCNTIAGQYVCEECRDRWNDAGTILDLLRECVEAKEPWALDFIDQIRVDFDADLFKHMEK